MQDRIKSKYGLAILDTQDMLESVKRCFQWGNVLNWDEYLDKKAEELGVSPRGRLEQGKFASEVAMQLPKAFPEGVQFYVLGGVDKFTAFTREMVSRIKPGRLKAMQEKPDLTLPHERWPVPEVLIFIMGDAGLFGMRENYCLRHSNTDKGTFADFFIGTTMERRQGVLRDLAG
jgi:hypothetical protein